MHLYAVLFQSMEPVKPGAYLDFDLIAEYCAIVVAAERMLAVMTENWLVEPVSAEIAPELTERVHAEEAGAFVAG